MFKFASIETSKLICAIQKTPSHTNAAEQPVTFRNHGWVTALMLAMAKLNLHIKH